MGYCARIYLCEKNSFFFGLLASFPLSIDVRVDVRLFSPKSGVRTHGGGATFTARLNSHKIPSRRRKKDDQSKNKHRHFFIRRKGKKRRGRGGGGEFFFREKKRKKHVSHSIEPIDELRIEAV